MPVKSLFGKTYHVVEQALDVAKRRHRVVANNIANVNTQGYKTKELPFEQALSKAIGQSRSVAVERTHPRHFPAQRGGGSDYDLSEASYSGVDIDKEMSKLAENNLKYQSGIELLLRKFSMLKHTITEGGR
jgi:flagellar basal-body rod protein FlgB